MKVTWDLYRQKYQYDGPMYKRYIRLIPEESRIVVEDTHRQVNGVSFAVHRGIEHQLNAEGLTKARLTELFRGEKWREAFATLCGGHSVEWGGSNFVGRHTEAAQQALIELENLLDNAKRTC